MKNGIKKILSLLLCTVMVAAILFSVPGRLSADAAGIAGDVDKSGKVNNKDVILLFRYISGARVDVDKIACDTNGDGVINNKDVIYLFRAISGYNIVLHYGKETAKNVFKEWSEQDAAAFKSKKQTSVSVSGDGILLTYEKSGAADPYVVFDIAAYEALHNLDRLTGKDGAYVVLKVRSNADGYVELFTHAPASGDRASATYKPDNEFHYVIVDMTKTTLTEPDELSTIRIDWAGAEVQNGDTMLISEIGFFSELEAAKKYTGLSDKKAVKTVTIPTAGSLSDYVTSANATLVQTENGVSATSKGRVARLVINVKAIAEDSDSEIFAGRYIAVRFKAEGFTTVSAALETIVDISGVSASASQNAYMDQSDGWQGVMFEIKNTNLYENELKKLTVMFGNYTTSTKVTVASVTVSDNINDALEACGKSEYMLNYDEALTDNDELSDKTLIAEHEDDTFDLWFDQTTEKTYRNDIKSTGKTGYTVRMAKNEAENCQFFVAPAKDMSIRVEVEEFKNANGKTVPYELYYEFYHNINGTLIPDALPPLTGAIDIKAGRSQGFVIQLTTSPGAEAGVYNSTIHVYDNATGNEIKRAPVAVKVWDFELSEKTELRTAFLNWPDYITNSYNWNNVSFSEAEVQKNYFEFFLKYRINLIDVYNGMTSSYGTKWMAQDRVNTARWYNLDVSVTEDMNGEAPEWLNKVIYYTVDEPSSSEQLNALVENANRIRKNTPDYRMVSPMDRNLDLTSDGKLTSFSKSDIDQIGFMSQAVNIWCPKLDAFTTRDLGFVCGVSYLQSREQDEKYGTFAERMKKEVEEGDELWTYICVTPTDPYVNWQILSDGTEAVVSAWQMKEYGITGMLYWAVDYWRVSYWNTEQPWSGAAYGDGMLIYSGYYFGLPYPISSLRLENIRDGIEDYQMLCMLEEKLGTDAVRDIISRVTTSVVTYTDNDDYLHAVRVLLGDMLEQAFADQT